VVTRIVNASRILGFLAFALGSAVPARAWGAPTEPSSPAGMQQAAIQTSPPAPPAASIPPLPAAASPPLAPPPSAETVSVPAPPSDPSTQRGTVALVAAGVAVLSAGVGVVFGVLALQDKNDYGKHPTYSNVDDGTNDAAYADGCIALPVAAGVTSLVLSLTSADGAQPAASVPKKRSAAFSASPIVTTITTHGGSAGVLLRF
jgi:hypothetical protein